MFVEKSPRRLATAVAVMVLSALLTATSFAAPKRYTTQLSGVNVSPAVTTQGRGETHLRLSQDGLSLAFRIDVSKMANITGAHIHLGPTGESGEAVATLFTSPTPVNKARGTLARGTLKASDLTGSLAGKTLTDLVKEIEAGRAYVDVHTTQHSDGEIRGQLRAR